MRSICSINRSFPGAIHYAKQFSKWRAHRGPRILEPLTRYWKIARIRVTECASDRTVEIAHVARSPLSERQCAVDGKSRVEKRTPGRTSALVQNNRIAEWRERVKAFGTIAINQAPRDCCDGLVSPANHDDDAACVTHRNLRRPVISMDWQ